MHKLTRMKYSRNDWKEKAVIRATKIRAFRKTVARKDCKIAELEEKLNLANQANQALNVEKKTPYSTKSGC